MERNLSETRVWREYGEEEYLNVESSSAKKALDTQISLEIYKSVQDSTPPAVVGELGCGPAPIARKLLQFNEKWGEKLFETVGFDISSGMINHIPEHEDFSFEIFDIAKPDASHEYFTKGGKPLDVVVLENSWYATTTGVGHDREESAYRRLVALQNAWSVLKDDGILIISDPTSETENLNFKNTLQGFSSEITSAIRRGEVKQSIQNIMDPRTHELIRRNREEILPTSCLLSHEQMIEAIKNSGLFEILEVRENEYMGNNSTFILKKSNNPEMKVNGTFILKTTDSKASNLIADFRKTNYSAKVNPIVTGIDEQDFVHKESYTAMSTLKGTYLPGAIASYDLEDDYNNDSWEFAELFNLDDDLMTSIVPGNRRTAEIRRLGTIGVYDDQYKRLGFESMINVIGRMYEEAGRRDVGILFFTATPDRLKLFNGILMRLGAEKFIEVPNVKLDREKDSNLRIFLAGSEYFFTEEANRKLEKNDSLVLLKEYLIENKERSFMEAITDLWPHEGESKAEEFRQLLQNSRQIPSNASLYFSLVKKK
jgi:SAM-dependent methyltransferase